MAADLSITPGLRVLVTAGASGIGRVIAARLAEQGARVALCDVDEEALDRVQSENPDFIVRRCDVAEEPEVASLFDIVAQQWDGLDVLVNNAGIAGPTGGVGEIDPVAWQRTVAINLNGQFYCAHHGLALLRRSEEPAILCISSVAGRLGFAYRTPYAATKWGIIGLVKSLANELGPEGIRVNAILPGIVEGPRIESVFAAKAETLGKSHEEVKSDALSRVSLRRMVSAEDVANTALFLCSPLGRNISGQPISVCGNVEVI